MGRRADLLDRVANEIGGLAVAGDAANCEDMRRAIDTIVQRWDRLDVLMASAGSVGRGGALDTSDEAWDESLHANLDSAFVAARQALPLLIRSRGSIVIISSAAGLFADNGLCGYVTAKHALIGLTRSLARDYGPQGVRVNAVCPGWVRTAMADESMKVLMERHGISLEDAYALATSDAPLRRPATPDEIAAVCHFLASDGASIITGVVLPADGGASIVNPATLAFRPSDALQALPGSIGVASKKNLLSGATKKGDQTRG